LCARVFLRKNKEEKNRKKNRARVSITCRRRPRAEGVYIYIYCWRDDEKTCASERTSVGRRDKIKNETFSRRRRCRLCHIARPTFASAVLCRPTSTWTRTVDRGHGGVRRRLGAWTPRGRTARSPFSTCSCTCSSRPPSSSAYGALRTSCSSSTTEKSTRGWPWARPSSCSWYVPYTYARCTSRRHISRTKHVYKTKTIIRTTTACSLRYSRSTLNWGTCVRMVKRIARTYVIKGFVVSVIAICLCFLHHI